MQLKVSCCAFLTVYVIILNYPLLYSVLYCLCNFYLVLIFYFSSFSIAENSFTSLDVVLVTVTKLI